YNGSRSKRIGINLDGLRARIFLYDGIPTIVKANNLPSVLERDRLPELLPHYFLRLGFECAMSKSARGRLVLYYRNVPNEDGKLPVYDVSFRDLESLKAELLSRINLLRKVENLKELPSCPSWMCRFCKYQPECG
ncbi:MAG: hypothetical protein QMC90_04760, partial [Dehalococcoidales bacterium]|nr:hypothetical protein [Dehalococcoidales bacterium]